MASQKQVDDAIFETIRAAGQPVSLKSLLHKMEDRHLGGGRSIRAVSNRVYEMRREGLLVQVGIGRDVRYELPASEHTNTEAARQAAEGRRRNASEQSPPPPTTVVEKPRPEPAELHELADSYVFGAKPPTDIEPAAPGAVVVVEATGQTLAQQVKTISQHIGTTVTLTVEKLINDALAKSQAEIDRLKQNEAVLWQQNNDLARALEEKGRDIEQLSAELKDQEELYNELDARLTKLKKKVAEDIEAA